MTMSDNVERVKEALEKADLKQEKGIGRVFKDILTVEAVPEGIVVAVEVRG